MSKSKEEVVYTMLGEEQKDCPKCKRKLDKWELPIRFFGSEYACSACWTKIFNKLLELLK